MVCWKDLDTYSEINGNKQLSTKERNETKTSFFFFLRAPWQESVLDVLLVILPEGETGFWRLTCEF